MQDQPMTRLVLGGIPVFFPFQPYEVQKKYMTKVIESIENRYNALLESPTGTGKTLSLLCASLAWLQAKTDGQKMIYYTSRTHLQLSQAAKEMKRTAYSRIPSVVIGSRAQMCLNGEVRQQPANLINRSCRNAIAKNACSYYVNYEQKLEGIEKDSAASDTVHDIEDLEKFGRAHQCCPYYASRKLAETKASIVFMPYNYLLDTSLKKSNLLKLENSVIIFDEAHNIEDALSEAASGAFRESCLKTIMESCSTLPSKVSDALHKEKGLSRTGYDPKEKTSDDTSKSRGKEKEPKVNLIEELAEKLTTTAIQQVNNCVQLIETKAKEIMKINHTCDINQVYSVMESSGIHYATSSTILTTLESMISFWSIAGVVNVSQISKYVVALGNFRHVVSLLYPEECLSVARQKNHRETLTNYYKAHLKGINKPGIIQDGPLIDWELNVWCLHPKIGLDRVIDEHFINGPRSLIITSGTLSPRNAIIDSLGRKFKCSEGFEHVIGDGQLKIITIAESPKGFKLIAKFENTQKVQFALELGKTILPVLAMLPFGTLIFFPSYALMNSTISRWKSLKEWTVLSKTTSIFIECSEKDTFEANMLSYKRQIGSSNGNVGGRALFFGVCRGKLSEGTNLEGNYCRSVVVVGLPYPNIGDPRVVATKNFHDATKGKMWYHQQMRRALNQTLGRAIRSRSDYGLLILCDERYKQMRYSVSEWAHRFFPDDITNPTAMNDIVTEFFKSHGVDVIQPAVHDFAQASGSSAFEFDSSNTIRPSSRAVLTNSVPFDGNQPPAIGRAHANGSLNTFSKSSLTPFTSTPRARAPLNAAERLQQMKNSYTVDQETFNRLKRTQNQSQPEEPQEPITKKPKGIFDALFSLDNQASTQLTATQPSSSNDTQKTIDYSTLEQDKNGPSKWKCYVCSNGPKRPFALNCRCAKVGCWDCLKGLHKKECGKCKQTFDKTKFKQKLFHSAFSGQERLTTS